MGQDPERLRYLAARGHFGHAALLDPDAYVAANAPQEESSFQQAARELPGDIQSAFSSEGLSNSLGMAGRAIKTGLFGD